MKNHSYIRLLVPILLAFLSIVSTLSHATTFSCVPAPPPPSLNLTPNSTSTITPAISVSEALHVRVSNDDLASCAPSRIPIAPKNEMIAHALASENYKGYTCALVGEDTDIIEGKPPIIDDKTRQQVDELNNAIVSSLLEYPANSQHCFSMTVLPHSAPAKVIQDMASRGDFNLSGPSVTSGTNSAFAVSSTLMVLLPIAVYISVDGYWAAAVVLTEAAVLMSFLPGADWNESMLSLLSLIGASYGLVSATTMLVALLTEQFMGENGAGILAQGSDLSAVTYEHACNLVVNNLTPYAGLVAHPILKPLFNMYVGILQTKVEKGDVKVNDIQSMPEFNMGVSSMYPFFTAVAVNSLSTLYKAIPAISMTPHYMAAGQYLFNTIMLATTGSYLSYWILPAAKKYKDCGNDPFLYLTYYLRESTAYTINHAGYIGGAALFACRAYQTMKNSGAFLMTHGKAYVQYLAKKKKT